MKWKIAFIVVMVALVGARLWYVNQPKLSPTSAALGSAGSQSIRQEVNITDAYMYAGSGSYATSSEIVGITDNNYTTPAYYFEVVASTTAGTTASVDLVNATSSAKVATVSITGGNTYTRYRSTQFLPNASTTVEYKVRLNNESIGKGIIAARIVILQDTSSLTNTETQIEIGSNETYTSVSTTTFAAPKYWSYNSSHWDASPTFYAEVTYASQGISATSTDSFTTAGATTWTAPAQTTNVAVAAWGGGGAGFDGSTAGGGDAGGGGAFASSSLTVIGGVSYALTVGAGGTASAMNGATTTFATTTISTASVAAAPGWAGNIDAQAACAGSGNSGHGLGGAVASSTGQVVKAGGRGGAGCNGSGNSDQGGGGGGAGGPHAAGTAGNSASGTIGGAGGQGDGTSGGAGGAAGNGGGGGAATASTLGGGGGGGGDDGSTGAIGATAGAGGGGGETGQGNGAGGQITIDYRFKPATTTIAIEESADFITWTAVATIVPSNTFAVSTSTRVRVAFTPTNGKYYRIGLKSGYNGATQAIYNAKIVVDQASTPTIDKSYLTGSGGSALSSAFSFGDGQCFTSGGGTLARASFKLNNTNSPTGNAVSKIYAITGSCGTTAKPTGSALATSDNLDVSTLPTSATLTDINFSGANQITLSNGTSYFVSIEYSGGDINNAVNVTQDNSGSGTDPGNEANENSSSVWTASATNDDVFRVYVLGGGPTLLEPQYLLAPFKLPAGTSITNFLTSFDTTDWLTTNNYIHAVSASDNNTSVIEIDNTTGPTQITGSSISSPDNYATSTGMCLSSTATLAPKITTDNGSIYSSSIIVQVGTASTAGSCGVTTPLVPHVIIQSQTIIKGQVVIP